MTKGYLRPYRKKRKDKPPPWRRYDLRLLKMTKEELKQYRSIKTEISQIERRILEFEGLGRDKDIIQPLINLYREKLADLIEEQLKIEKVIEVLDPTERELIRLRYIDGLEWIDVAAEIHYEWTQTHRIHARALSKIKSV